MDAEEANDLDNYDHNQPFDEPEPDDEPDAAFTDTELLDFLESMKRGYGYGWVLRDSVDGRGMRLHETSSVDHDTHPTAREAIAAVITKDLLE